ncbi:MAG: DUF6152 family protein [Acidobacteria bacterium]|nr:DUF6152 family protein [Acidobacteriota bacterium]
MRRVVLCSLVAAMLLTPSAGAVATAHHSFAMYAMNEDVVIRGTVTRFRWVNPHSVLSIIPAARDGEDQATWNIELSSPGNLTRTGWTRRSLNVDDQVEVTLHPLRNGDPGGACVSVTVMATGQMLECLAGNAIRAGERPNLP